MRGFLFTFISMSFLMMTSRLGGKDLWEFKCQSRLSDYSDTVPHNQNLFNGRIWRNLYLAVEGDQFLFSREFLEGTVTMRGTTYSGIRLKYDILLDEILVPYQPAGILQINREMVDSFSILFNNRTYCFERVSQSNVRKPDSYFNKLYNGKAKLFVWYEKKIEKLADGGKYDKFYQVSRICLSKDGEFHNIKGQKDIIGLFDENKTVIKKYFRKNHIRIRTDDPESCIPVLKFIESLSDQDTR